MSVSAQQESSLAYPGWRVAWAASGAIFFGFASLLVYTFGVFLKPLTEQFHWSREAASGAFGFAALSVAAVSPALGAILDRTDPRRILLPCFAIFGTAFISLAFLHGSIWQLYLTFTVLGIVGNGTAHLAFSGAITSWFYERRGAAFALLMSGGAMGAMLLPPIAQAFISHVGWRGAYEILGAAVLCCGLPLSVLVRKRPATSTQTQHVEGISVASAIKSYPFWVVIVILVGASLAQNGSITHMVALLTDRGLKPETAAFGASILGGSTLLGRLVTGWLLDRFFAPRVGFGMLAIAAVGTYLLAIAHSAELGFTAAALIGLGMGGEADVTPYLLSRYFGLRSFSTLYGLSWTAYAIAGAVGPAIMGAAFDKTGSYTSLLTLLAVFTFGTAGLLLTLPRFRDTNITTPDSELPLTASAYASSTDQR